jgi:hypothetical protein
MTPKRQILDPIGACCRLILLHFSEPGTKIRICDNLVQLVPNSYSEKLLYRPWCYGDSRDDMCLLLPTIIRFVELYAEDEKNINKENKQDTILDLNDIEINEEQNTDSDEERFEKNGTNDSNDETDLLDDDTFHSNKKCKKCLKSLASYIIDGISCLQKTYGDDNAALTLNLYSLLLKSAINGTYTSELLPDNMKNIMKNNILNTQKIQSIWKDETIIRLTELFENCFVAEKQNNIELLRGYKAAICMILNERDKQFQQIVGY